MPVEGRRNADNATVQNNIDSSIGDIQSFLNNYSGGGGGGDMIGPTLNKSTNNGYGVEVNKNGLYDGQSSSQKINNGSGSSGMLMASGEADINNNIAQGVATAMPIKGGNGMEESDMNNNNIAAAAVKASYYSWPRRSYHNLNADDVMMTMASSSYPSWPKTMIPCHTHLTMLSHILLRRTRRIAAVMDQSNWLKKKQQLQQQQQL